MTFNDLLKQLNLTDDWEDDSLIFDLKQFFDEVIEI